MLRRALAVAIAAVGLSVAACAAPAALQDTIGLENRTSTAVAVHVNGGWAGTYAAGTSVNVAITGHGGPPYAIEVRSPSGAVLQSLSVTARDVHDVIGGASSESVGGNVGCGWIELSYGVRVVPSAGVPAQDPSGPCP